MSESAARRGRTAFVLATAAVVWAAGFTVWALTAAVYSDGQTILEANPETTVRIAVVIPLAVSALAWVLLRANRGWARRCGIAAAVFLVLFAVVTGFTIGLFVLPGSVALLAAAISTPAGST